MLTFTPMLFVLTWVASGEHGFEIENLWWYFLYVYGKNLIALGLNTRFIQTKEIADIASDVLL